MARGLGLLLPFRRGNGGYFEQGFDILTQAKSNLINLVLTKKGERLLQPDFGCDVHSIVFEQITDESLANVRGSVESAVRIWLPYINIVDVEVSKNEDLNTIFAKITFSLTNNPDLLADITLEF